MKKVGIIGGLGPETTAKFYLEIASACQEINNKFRPAILIISVPLPYKIEKEAIVEGRGEERCVPFIVEAAKKLEKAGADFLVMPCNSLHAFIGEIRGAVKIPVISIVEEVADFLKKENISEIGIIATAITVNKKLYETFLTKNNIKQIKPNNFHQAQIGKIIHDIVLNKVKKGDKEKLISIVNSFKKRGVKNIILACTDLQLLISSHPKLKIYDTMKIFSEATVKKILEK